MNSLREIKERINAVLVIKKLTAAMKSIGVIKYKKVYHLLSLTDDYLNEQIRLLNQI